MTKLISTAQTNLLANELLEFKRKTEAESMDTSDKTIEEKYSTGEEESPTTDTFDRFLSVPVPAACYTFCRSVQAIDLDQSKQTCLYRTRR